MNGNSTALRECVVERLELTPEADDAAVRCALIGLLQTNAVDGETGLEPALEVGACLVAGRQVRRSVAIPVERVRARKRIENLCSHFFELSPEDRAREFQQVKDDCQKFRELTARLMALKPGLEVCVEDMETLSEPAQTLSRFACELFVLPPMERIQRRHEILRTLRPETCKSAVNILRADASKVAALCPRFFEDVAALGTQDAIVRSAVRKQARELKSNQTWSSQQQSSDSGAGSHNYWWLVVPLFFLLIRLVDNAPSSPRHSSRDFNFQPSSTYRSNQLNRFSGNSNSRRRDVDPAISQFVADELLKRQADPGRRSQRIVTSIDELREKYGQAAPSGSAAFPRLSTPSTSDAARLVNSLKGANAPRGKRYEVVSVGSVGQLDSKIEEIEKRYRDQGVKAKVTTIRSDLLATRPLNEINDILPYVAPAFIRTLNTTTSEVVRLRLCRQIQELLDTCDTHINEGGTFSPQAAAALENLRSAL